eukprot:1086744-Rhodomonas_salina.2
MLLPFRYATLICYAMPMCYALSGTEIGYAATNRSLRPLPTLLLKGARRYPILLRACYALSGILLRTCYALSGTDIA